MKYQTLIDAYDLTDKTSQDLSGESSCYPQLLRRIVREDGEEIFKPITPDDKEVRSKEYAEIVLKKNTEEQNEVIQEYGDLKIGDVIRFYKKSAVTNKMNSLIAAFTIVNINNATPSPVTVETAVSKHSSMPSRYRWKHIYNMFKSYPMGDFKYTINESEDIFKPADKKERQAEYYHHMFDQLEEQYGKNLIIPGNYFKSYRSYANDYKYSIITRIDKDIGYIYFYPKYLSTQGHLVRMLKRSDTVAPVEQSESFDSLIMKDYSPMIRKAKSYFGFLTADEMQVLVDKQPNLKESSDDIFKSASKDEAAARKNEFNNKRLQQNLESKKVFDEKYGPLKVGDKLKTKFKPTDNSAQVLSFVSVVKELKDDPVEGPVIFFNGYSFLRTYSYVVNPIAWPNLEVIHI